MNYVEKINDNIVKASKHFHSLRLGASAIGSTVGAECDRYLWYSYRWYPQKKDTAEQIRAKVRGIKSEHTILLWLREAGATITDVQKKFIKENLVAKIDGVIDNDAVLSLKVLKQKYFNPIKKRGIKKAAFHYWLQSQIEMYLTGLSKTYYLIWCKNTEELYEENITRSDEVNYHIKRAKDVTKSTKPPLRISENADYWLCKSLCPFREFCHFAALAPQNCRTCAHVDCSQWLKDARCTKGKIIVDPSKGCASYELPPDESETFFSFPE